MAFEDIEKLKTRVERDPHSRLFLPLAEEYRKSGMIDEAIAVTLKGLERHPGYTSAHVALGRLYLEKNLVPEARAEFEKVIASVPDNLFAHRKLADIYRDLGENEKALSEYRMVLNLNPRDEEIKRSLEILEEETERLPPPSLPSWAEGGELKEEPVVQTLQEEPGGDQTVSPGDSLVSERPESSPAEESPAGEFDEAAESFSIQLTEASPVVQPASEEIIETPSAPDREFPGVSILENVSEIPDFQAAYEDFWRGSNVAPCDSLIVEGSYYRALDAFRDLLKSNPDNKHIFQRIAELKAFLRLLGKGEEALIAKLESFLDEVKRRFGRVPE
jgi:tetratricopeptide (TPR) repeat protein